MSLQLDHLHLSADTLDAAKTLSEATDTDALSQTQVWGVVAAAAFAATDGALLDTLTRHAHSATDDDVLGDAAGAATVMGMTNVYYRFLTLIDKPEYKRLPPGLQMTRLGEGRSGTGHMDLFALAVSVINGCGTCIKSHESQLIADFGKEGVQATVRLAAAVNGLALADRASKALHRLNEGQIRTVTAMEAPAVVGPYSQAVLSNGLLFASGQLGTDPTSGELQVGAGEQAAQCLRNLSHVLKTAGAKPSDVIRTTVYITNLSDFDSVNSAYIDFFGAHRPARVLVEVAGLVNGALVEIDVIASVPS